MSWEEEQKKIIDAARKVFPDEEFYNVTPNIGKVGLWLMDYGFYVILCEVRSYKYFAAGACFLWSHTEDLNNTLSYDCFLGKDDLNRLPHLEGYSDEAMAARCCSAALRAAKKYIRLSDFNFAEYCLGMNNNKYWNTYDLSMLCFLFGKFKKGRKYFEEFLKISSCTYDFADEIRQKSKQQDLFLGNWNNTEWQKKFYTYCTENILPKISNKENAQKMVIDMINKRRKDLHEKYKLSETEFTLDK